VARDLEESPWQVWHADDVGALLGLLRLLAVGRSLKHLFWRYLGQRQCLPHPCLRQMLPNAGLGLVLLNACLRLVLSHLSFLLPVVCCMPNGGGGLDWWHDALAHALSAFFASCFLCLLLSLPPAPHANHCCYVEGDRSSETECHGHRRPSSASPPLHF